MSGFDFVAAEKDLDAATDPGDLRDRFKAQLNALKTEFAAAKEAAQKFEEFQKQSAKSKALSEAKVPEDFQNLFHGDPTEENVKAFVDTYGKYWANGSQAPAGQDQPANQTTAQPEVQQAYQALANLDTGTPANSAPVDIYQKVENPQLGFDEFIALANAEAQRRLAAGGGQQ